MNKLVCLLLIAAFSLGICLHAADRSIWVNEDFSGTFPPEGWTFSAHAANWAINQGAMAGGSAPELRFSWEPQFNGSTYLISPTYDTTGETTVFVDFDHHVDWYANPFTVGLATRSNGGAWTVAWSQNPTANIAPNRRTVSVTNADVGSTSFQFALYFSGNSYNIDYWYINNVKLYTPFAYDLAVTSVAGSEHVEAGTPIVPSCVVKNVGMGTLTASVSLEIYQNESLINSYNGLLTEQLDVNETYSAIFPQFNPEVANELYRFVFSVSSLEDVVDGDLTNNSMVKAMNTWTGSKQNVLLEIGTGG